MRKYNLLELSPMLFFIFFFDNDQAKFCNNLWISGFAGIIVSIILYYKKVQRSNLVATGFTLFFIVGALACMGNVDFILQCFYAYTGAIMFAFISLVGLIATLFSSAGFVNVVSSDTKSIRLASLKLMAVCVLMIVVSFFTQSYGWRMSYFITYPLILLIVIYDRLRDKLLGIPDEWAIKW